MQPNTTPSSPPAQAQEARPMPPINRPGFTPPAGLPLVPPADLPQSSHAGHGGIVAWGNNPKNKAATLTIAAIVTIVITTPLVALYAWIYY